MKKLFFIAAAIVMFSAVSFGQSYKPFKVGLGALYAIPTGDGAGGGVGFYLEPKYNLNDKFDMGLLLESALLASDVDGASASISGVTSYSLTGDYMMGTGKTRPFVGLGLGIYSLGSVEFDSQYATGNVELGSKFGFSPRVGINLSHFQLQLQYHMIMGQAEGISKSYLAIKMGIEFGGGLK